MHNLNQLRILTIAALKMYYRNWSAVFFSIFIPILIIVIFGVILGNGNNTKFALAYVDHANNTYSKQLETTLEKTNAFSITKANHTNAITQLKQGNEDLVIEIPENFVLTPTATPATIQGYYDQAKAQNAQISFLIINNILLQTNQAAFAHITHTSIPALASLKENGIQTNNLTEIDFLVPGMIAFSLMQLGLFSVAFAFTSMKKTGALRRLQATPAKPLNFILSQAFARLILSFIQVFILLGVGIYAFHLHMYGNIFLFFLFIILGAVVFLSMGFAIAGYAKDENQAAPITNLISLPMTFLSGVFFPRSLMPDFLKHITDFLPLSYLSDALRSIANNNATLSASSIRTDLIGLIVWSLITLFIAVKVFKWE